MTRSSRARWILSVALAVAVAAPAVAQSKAPAKSKTAGSEYALLPGSFAGWQRQSDQLSQDPAQADPANPAVMKECGLDDFEHAVYAREGRKLDIKAARFADAGGAYAAFTFYRQPQMVDETIGDQAASQGNDVLFYRGQVLVFARLDNVTAMSAAELRELSSVLPRPAGTSGNQSTLPGYLPKQGLVADSQRYILGATTLSLERVPLSADLVRFDQGAEVVTARYNTNSGDADLILIGYPTPQIAGQRFRALEAFASQTANGGEPHQSAVRRSGPIVAFATGNISASDAKSLVGGINYEATVTWNEATSLSKRDNVGSLIVAALALCGIVLVLALAAGIAFGGFRILMKRWFPDRVFDRSTDVEIIRLDIGE